MYNYITSKKTLQDLNYTEENTLGLIELFACFRQHQKVQLPTAQICINI